jgi:DNA-binding transcriptional LysR family regulator
MAMLKEIRAFCTVARLGSLTRAADELGTSQPSVSRRISALEQELGVSLIVHGSRPLRLTETGRLVAELSEPYLQRLSDIASQARGAAAAAHLSVVTLRPYHDLVMPSAVREFQERQPNAQIRLHARARHDALDMVEEGRCDFGILPDLNLGPHFRFECLSRFPILMAAQVVHPLMHKSQVTLEEIVQFPLVLRPKGIWTRDYLDSVFAEHRLEYRGYTEVDTVEMGLRLAAFESAVTFVSPVFDVCAVDSTLAVRSFPELFPDLQMGVVTALDRPLSQLARSFIDILRGVLDRMLTEHIPGHSRAG